MSPPALTPTRLEKRSGDSFSKIGITRFEGLVRASSSIGSWKSGILNFKKGMPPSIVLLQKGNFERHSNSEELLSGPTVTMESYDRRGEYGIVNLKHHHSSHPAKGLSISPSLPRNSTTVKGQSIGVEGASSASANSRQQAGAGRQLIRLKIKPWLLTRVQERSPRCRRSRALG